MQSDIQIAQQARLLPIDEIGRKVGLQTDDLDLYGKYKAKVSVQAEQKLQSRPNGKLVLVSAINPTPAGEGKTTVSVGLAQAMWQVGKPAVLSLREPSLGPVFGIKGGAAGGGYSQVVPMEDINLHFTGDMHAITAANNLLCALVDNHLQQGNQLGIDPRQITLKRCIDLNDRALRFVNVGLGGRVNGVPREDGFQITVASEIMAILCLAENLDDLKSRLGKMLIGYRYDGAAVTVADLGAQGAMTALLKDALQPNLVQTLENTPALVHGGPFANIAHGCSSVKATKLALKLSGYAITEAGFGSDLGAEKFMDIKCRYAGLEPDCVVLVATVRALKYNGGVAKQDLGLENPQAVAKGTVNLGAHIENMRQYGIPVVVAINQFATDSEQELAAISAFCDQMACPYAFTRLFAEGGKGGIALAEQVIAACQQPHQFSYLYPLDLSIEDKIRRIATKIYHADDVIFTRSAQQSIDKCVAMGYGSLPVCVAKTQYSLSDDPTLLGRPEGFVITVREIRLSAGAGFVVALTGEVMTMPGLPKTPAALSIDVIDGKIVGLF